MNREQVREAVKKAHREWSRNWGDGIGMSYDSLVNEIMRFDKPPTVTREGFKQVLMGCSQCPIGFQTYIRERDLWPAMKKYLARLGVEVTDG